MSEELNCMNCSIGDFKHNLCDCNNGFCKEFKSIGNQKDFFNAVMQRIRPQGEWIPCSERLPSEKDYIGDVVIWCTDKSIVGVGWYYESTKSWATIDDTFPPIFGEVIAWMPLPKPWKGAE